MDRNVVSLRSTRPTLPALSELSLQLLPASRTGPGSQWLRSILEGGGDDRLRLRDVGVVLNP